MKKVVCLLLLVTLLGISLYVLSQSYLRPLLLGGCLYEGNRAEGERMAMEIPIDVGFDSPTRTSKYKVTLLNNCPETIFFGAAGPSRVTPQTGEWMADPGESATILIPGNWLHTQVSHKRSLVGPRFWARTGCKFDVSENKAYCETGDCGNFYDCSAANLAGRAPTSLAEFCFECGDDYTYYDVSLVDGYSISVDIKPGTHSPTRPGDPGNPFWCKTELCNRGSDLRSVCKDNFTLFNTDLTSYEPSVPRTKVACFSNCGRYEYPVAPLGSCSDDNPTCMNWRRYCCQADTYGKPCVTGNDCTDGGACWNGTCQCKAYLTSPPCSPDICTNPDGQPQPGSCTDCVGDDLFHHTCPRAYTWPNDPQTYSCDATQYTITFCPGSTQEPITPALPIPSCSSLDSTLFDWQQAQLDCMGGHGTYLCAVRKDLKYPNNIWACDVDNGGCDNVVCTWE